MQRLHREQKVQFGEVFHMLEAGENEGAELEETGMRRPASPVRSLASVLGTVGATEGFTQGAAQA